MIIVRVFSSLFENLIFITLYIPKTCFGQKGILEELNTGMHVTPGNPSLKVALLYYGEVYIQEVILAICPFDSL
jgi:hypothetical protein